MNLLSSLKPVKMNSNKMSQSSSLSSTQGTSCDLGNDLEDFSVVFDPKSHLGLESFDEDLNDIIWKDETSQNETSPNTSAHISGVDRNDLQRISLIGSGQFCNVYSVTGVLSKPWENKNRGGDFSRKRSLLAFKSINQSRVRNSDDLLVAAVDLANEAKILSQLDHKNIIKLRGVSNQRFSKSFYPDSESIGDGFFLVLDILKDTLDQRLHSWRKHYGCLDSSKHSNKRLQLMSWKSRPTDAHCKEIMYQRVETIVKGIAEGIRYLHNNEIVLRDLKPSNIGFDFETGTEIRLFDFGMARRVTECLSNEICGSPRYMAPEAMSGQGYSLKVDSFSFGTLLFEICSLKVPYADNYWNNKKKVFGRGKNSPWSHFGTKPNHVKSKLAMLEDFYSCVVEDQLLPSEHLEDSISCPKIRALISDCWSRNPDDRPSFTEIVSRLNTVFDRQD